MAYLHADMTVETAKIRPVSVGSRHENAAALEHFAEGLNIQPWMDEAVCAGSGVNFFPERGDGTDHLKAMCSECPVSDECLEYGMMDKHGIWGGKSERERRVIRRERGVQIRLIRQPIRCVECGTEFVPASNGAKLCSDVCRKERVRASTSRRNKAYRERKVEASFTATAGYLAAVGRLR